MPKPSISELTSLALLKTAHHPSSVYSADCVMYETQTSVTTLPYKDLESCGDGIFMFYKDVNGMDTA